MALSQLKTRSLLERLAGGSVWSKFCWMWLLPILVLVVYLSTRINFSEHLPIIIIFLVMMIIGQSIQDDSRIDAIYRLMKEDSDTLTARIDQIEQKITPRDR